MQKRRNANFLSPSAQTTRKRFLWASIQNNPRSDFLEPGCRGHALECRTLCRSWSSWCPPGSWSTSPTCWVTMPSPAGRFVSWIAVFYMGIVEVPNLRCLFQLPGDRIVQSCLAGALQGFCISSFQQTGEKFLELLGWHVFGVLKLVQKIFSQQMTN